MNHAWKFAGIDVGGKRKGFHLVGLLEDGSLWSRHVLKPKNVNLTIKSCGERVVAVGAADRLFGYVDLIVFTKSKKSEISFDFISLSSIRSVAARVISILGSPSETSTSPCGSLSACFILL